MLFYFNISYHIIFYLIMAKHILSYFIKSNQIFKKRAASQFDQIFFPAELNTENPSRVKRTQSLFQTYFEIVQIYLVNSDLGMYL